MRPPFENVEKPLGVELPEVYEIRRDTTGFAGFETAFEPYLYQRAEHLSTQRPKNLISLGLWNTPNQRLDAFIHLEQAYGVAHSLPQAPFGGLQTISDISDDSLVLLLGATEQYCAEKRMQRLGINSAPVAYDQRQAALLQAVYQSCQFNVRHRYVNHHLSITSAPLAERLHPSERRRLRKCQRAGFKVGIWENPDPAQVYDFLSESRRRQGYPLSLDYDQLRLLLTHLPHLALVFVVKNKEQIISLTVGIRVSSRILYNFCPADNLDYRTYSPMVLLNCSLYEYAQSSGIELIDLGMSLDHLGNEKASLIRFKENLGAEKSEKVTYEKNFI